MMTKLVLASSLLVLLAGCGTWGQTVDTFNPIEYLQPYRIDIPQGNVLEQGQVRMLKPGMTPAQVRFLLGTPLLVDPFRSDRWDYAYVLRKGGKVVEQRHITVMFEDGKLARILGDVVPAAKASEPAAAEAAAPATPAEATPPAEAAAPAEPAGPAAEPEAAAKPAEATTP